jgi:cAMP-dependent protein kinase regulator
MFSKGAENTYLKTYVPGEAFGELALLYNAPRAASIQAKEDCCLFSLDRDTFNNIVKDSSIKKREKFETFLSKVQLLDSLDSYERNKICDCLVLETIRGAGSYIIRQGETGHTFFLVVDGTCSAYKRGDDGKEQEVFKYNANDYFGELALLRDEPRAASIKTTVLFLVGVKSLEFYCHCCEH